VTLSSTLTAIGAVAVSTCLLMAPATSARADTALPLGVPRVTGLDITTDVQDMVVAAGKVWVSTGNEVDVFSTAGKKLSTITGLLGPQGLIASADGTAVYVAVSQDARIATLNTTSMTETASWSAGPCPTHLALAGGRLFYGFGCQTWGGSLGSVSVADGSAGPVVADSLYSAPRLSGSGDTLVSAALGLSSTGFASYTAGADGTVTERATTSAGTVYDFAVSNDGTRLIVTGYGNGYRLDRYATSDLSTAGNVAMSSYPQAVAYSADGSQFAGAMGTSYTDMIRVFDDASATLTSNSRLYPANTSVNPGILPGTMAFSTNGTLLYGIAQDYDGIAKLVTATAQPVSVGRITATVSNPTKYGAKVIVRATGRAKTKITVVTRSSVGSVPDTTVSKVSDANGAVSIPISAKYNGTLTVSQPGDLRHTAVTSPAKAFRVPAAVSLVVKGAYSSRSGMQHFHKVSAVKVSIRVQPNRALTSKYTLQAKTGGSWKARNTVTLTAAGDGSSYIYLASANKNVRYRVVTTFAGDAYNARSPKVISKTIIID
jgi:hypothetical protein